MKWVMILAVLAVAGALALQAWLRFYPHDFAAFHRERPAPDGGDLMRTISTGVTVSVLVREPPDEVLTRLDGVILAAPRTRVVTGSVAAGQITYVTRTAFWGFPDVVYVQARAEEAGTRLLIQGRTWTAGYDWGVNRARVTDWLTRAGVPVPPEDNGSP